MAQAVEALDNLIREGRSNVMAKGGLLGALLKKSRAKKETARKKRYLKHYKKAGPRSAMTYAQWIKSGEEQAYFKGAGGRKGTVEAQLREAQIDPKRFKRKKK